MQLLLPEETILQQNIKELINPSTSPKINLFFISKKCSILDHGNNLPFDLVHFTKDKLSDIELTGGDVAEIIFDLNPNKAHHQYMIIIHMLQICGESIFKLLKRFFRNIFFERFALDW